MSDSFGISPMTTLSVFEFSLKPNSYSRFSNSKGTIPYGELKENNTQELVKDIEQLRLKLNLDQIILFGGSWGSTLSLAYAENYPENIKAMVLRGIYFPTQEEDNYRKRLAKYFPELDYEWKKSLPDSIQEINDSIILKLFQLENETERNNYMKLLTRLEDKAAGLYIEDSELDQYYNSADNFKKLSNLYVICYYYFANNCFLEEGQLLNNASSIPDIPVTIVHGRYDMLCPPVNAYKLHKALPGSQLIITEKAGHSMSEKPNEKELIKAMKDLEELAN
ncbi:MAG: alpha/beta fold hydrolase [Bacteroidales bacterium]|nr:alpha/beta fold hydrolase [Bacteroidales bacterium]